MQELNEEEEQELIHIKRLLDPESPTQKVRVSLSHKRIPHSYPVWDSLITKLNPLSQNFVMRDPTRCGFRVRDGQQRSAAQVPPHHHKRGAARCHRQGGFNSALGGIPLYPHENEWRIQVCSPAAVRPALWHPMILPAG